MAKDKIYIVTFEIHRDCQIRDYVYYCYAANAKEACNSCKYSWKGDGHQFHVHAVKSRIQDMNLLKARNWKSVETTGEDLMGKYIMTDIKTWRYKSGDHYVYPLSKEIY